MSLWAVGPDGRRIEKRWSVGAVRPIPNIIQERGTIINRSDPSFFIYFFHCMRDFWLQESLGGLREERRGGWAVVMTGKTGPKWVAWSEGTSRRAFWQFRSWSNEILETGGKPDTVSISCCRQHLYAGKAQYDIQSVYRKGCLLSTEICKMTNAW